MSEPVIIAICDRCGVQVEVHPPNLPASGGSASFHDNPLRGWQVLEFACGPCWRARRTYWTCPHCGNGGEELDLRCRGCGRAKPGLPLYQPDWDAIGRELEERKRQAETLASEWDREYPWWRSPPRRERL